MDFQLDHYMIRRKILTFFGASFHVKDRDGEVVGFSRQKAFKLKEDIRLFADESKTTELLSIQARQIVDFSAAYDIVDSAGNRKVGAARRKGWSSILRDSWELLDEHDQPLAKISEDSTMMAILRRFLSNWIPQRFRLIGHDRKDHAMLRVRFNPFIYKLEVDVEPTTPIDRRLILGAAILIAAVEGRQR